MHWAGASYRYWPYEFEIRSQTIDRYGEDKIPEDMNLQDWGITYEELEPYYENGKIRQGFQASRIRWHLNVINHGRTRR